ncbi:hypothetical protein K439DRAFT_1071093 [Ramaria rubella]|nr:hypothetical protein K439DRAFT_1071093 [Ramaria rubella]
MFTFEVRPKGTSMKRVFVPLFVYTSAYASVPETVSPESAYASQYRCISNCPPQIEAGMPQFCALDHGEEKWDLDRGDETESRWVPCAGCDRLSYASAVQVSCVACSTDREARGVPCQCVRERKCGCLAGVTDEGMWRCAGARVWV